MNRKQFCAGQKPFSAVISARRSVLTIRSRSGRRRKICSVEISSTLSQWKMWKGYTRTAPSVSAVSECCREILKYTIQTKIKEGFLYPSFYFVKLFKRKCKLLTEKLLNLSSSIDFYPHNMYNKILYYGCLRPPGTKGGNLP